MNPDPPNTVATLRVAIAPPSCRCIVKRVLSPRRPGGYGEICTKAIGGRDGPAVGAGFAANLLQCFMDC